MRVLGIESSCDETAVAVIDSQAAPGERVLSQALHSQIKTHAQTGGVVPEVAARSHVQRIDGLFDQALAQANLAIEDLDLIAAVAGPGLIGGVSVGLTFAKGLALASGLPLQPVNHLAGHALTARLTHDVAYPFLLLLVSGGHCQLLVVEGPTRFHRWGTTIDDAVGEAFDKSAKILGLGFPGGPALEIAAQQGDPKRFDLPRPMLKKPGVDFSFSGLKTAVARALEDCRTPQDRHDLAASFQAAARDSLVGQTRKAMVKFVERYEDGTPPRLVVAGGVAANLSIRSALLEMCEEFGARFTAPPLGLCTDNAAMIAWAGFEQFEQFAHERLNGSAQVENSSEATTAGAFAASPLDFDPRPRWPLDPAAEPSTFAGAAKA